MKQDAEKLQRDVYIVDGLRTPFLKAGTSSPFSASDLAVAAGKALLNRQPFTPSELSQVIIGCVMPGADEANIARIIALRLGCKTDIPAYTVMRNCGSGMQALDSAALEIAAGRADLILAGGTEAMSRAPFLYNQPATKWFKDFNASKTWQNKLVQLSRFRPGFLKPVPALLKGLTDPLINMNMGQTAEKLAFEFEISREEMDAFAEASHLRLAKAYENDGLSEITPLIDNNGNLYTQDDGLRPDTSMTKLGKLKPFFDSKYGLVTAGNSSQVTDGACLLVLASKEAVKKYKLPVLGRIVDTHWAGLDPSQMGLGPVHALIPLMQKHHLKMGDLDGLEINEAFASQVIACLRALNDNRYCKTHFDLAKPFTAPSLDLVNKEGGAIALGHPVGASGARIVLHLLKSLEKSKGNRGIAALCIGGGQGGAMYIERLNEVRA